MADNISLKAKTESSATTDVPITITLSQPGNKFHVNPETANVDENQTVVWTCAINNFRIVFPGESPNTHTSQINAQQMPDFSFQASLFVDLHKKDAHCPYNIIPPHKKVKDDLLGDGDGNGVIIVECSTCGQDDQSEPKGKRE